MDKDCSSAVNNSECVDGRCHCIFDHVWTPHTGQCQYDGEDTRHKVVGLTLIAGVVVVGVVDVVLVACVIAHSVKYLRKHAT